MQPHSAFAGSYENLTATSDGVAASITLRTTFVTSNDDNDLDNITLANGVIGDEKIFIMKSILAGDSVKITPASANNFTQITFTDAHDGLGCIMVFDGSNWNVASRSRGTIA